MTTAPRPDHAPAPAPRGLTLTEPFRTAEEAWFWTMACLIARRDGARIVSGAALVARPCEPDDVVKCLDRLYRQRRIELQHVRILRLGGTAAGARSALPARAGRLAAVAGGDDAARLAVAREGYRRRPAAARRGRR